MSRGMCLWTSSETRHLSVQDSFTRALLIIQVKNRGTHRHICHLHSEAFLHSQARCVYLKHRLTSCLMGLNPQPRGNQANILSISHLTRLHCFSFAGFDSISEELVTYKKNLKRSHGKGSSLNCVQLTKQSKR